MSSPLDSLEITQQFPFLEKNALLERTAQFIQNILHTILRVHLLQVKVLSL